MDERVKTFIEELTLLTKKHDIHLWACSCCNAINLVDTKTGKTLLDCVDYDEEKGYYSFPV